MWILGFMGQRVSGKGKSKYRGPEAAFSRNSKEASVAGAKGMHRGRVVEDGV